MGIIAGYLSLVKTIDYSWLNVLTITPHLVVIVSMNPTVCYKMVATFDCWFLVFNKVGGVIALCCVLNYDARIVVLVCVLQDFCGLFSLMRCQPRSTY